MPGDAHELADRLRRLYDKSEYIGLMQDAYPAADELERLAAENAAMKAHMEALRQQTCPCYLYTDPDCPYLASAGPPQEHTTDCAWYLSADDIGNVPCTCIASAGPPQPAPREPMLAADPPPERRCTCIRKGGWVERVDPACPEHGR